MRERRPGGTWFLLALAIASTPAHAQEQAAPAGGACERLVHLNLSRMARSPLMDLQLRAQAHGITKLMVDALGRQLPSGKWREGEPHWEEAYALLNPELSAHMRSAGEQELRHQEANLPRHLDGATCEKHLAEQEKASREAGEQMIARHKEKLVEIIRRFRRANGP